MRGGHEGSWRRGHAHPRAAAPKLGELAVAEVPAAQLGGRGARQRVHDLDLLRALEPSELRAAVGAHSSAVGVAPGAATT